jgi:D-alanyl-D-alanine carboxypeptidase
VPRAAGWVPTASPRDVNWLPLSVPPTGDLPPIAAAAYVVADGDAGEPLASYNADQPRPVASLAKLMTARLVRDAGHLEHTATVPPLQRPAVARAWCSWCGTGVGVRRRCRIPAAAGAGSRR